MYQHEKPADAKPAEDLHEGDLIVFTTRDGECSWKGTVMKTKKDQCLVKSIGFRKWIYLSDVLWKENRNTGVA